jgi:FMN phosphatase YigB (HAD superfamily)
MMRYKAVLLDAFGTILQINPGKHPYRQLLKEGLKNGRRPSPDDAKNLMRFNGGLSEAADHLGISVHPSRLAEIEEILEDEVSSIEAFPDALEAVALLQERSRLVAVGFSYEMGLVKPDPRMYQATCEMIGVESDNGFGENRVIMVGDSLRCDCHGPREVGITGIHLDRSKCGGINDLMVFTSHVLRES